MGSSRVFAAAPLSPVGTFAISLGRKPVEKRNRFQSPVGTIEPVDMQQAGNRSVGAQPLFVAQSHGLAPVADRRSPYRAQETPARKEGRLQLKGHEGFRK